MTSGQDMSEGPRTAPSGLVYVYIGDGDGKTCAAIGHAVRAAGHGKSVAIIHFMKGRKSGEYLFLKGVRNVDVYLEGPPFFLRTEEDRKAHHAKARSALKLAKEILNDEKYDLVILDEILYALKYDLLTEEELLSLLDMRGRTHVVLTGRDAGDRILEKSDVVTKTRDVKHHYSYDGKTVLGLDY